MDYMICRVSLHDTNTYWHNFVWVCQTVW